MLNQLISELNSKFNQEKSKTLSRYFKTGKGEYGEGDHFLGITVPDQRKIATKYLNLEFPQITDLLKSRIHEHRLVALLILVENFQNSTKEKKQQIVNFYLENTKYINNWDLVDLTASKILGNYLLDKDRSILYNLAKSDNLWERRISIIATYEFIKNNQFTDTLELSKLLLNDKHDLIHKAVGWMLRELGKKNHDLEIEFLIKNYKTLHRTTLRYAIEKLDKTTKKELLSMNK